MQNIGELWRRLLHLFHRRQFESDLDEEIAFHLEMKGGAEKARRAFGNVALMKESARGFVFGGIGLHWARR